MESYTLNLRHYLILEAECTASTGDRLGGVLDYTLQQFAYNAILRRYPESRRDEALSYEHVCQIYSYGELWVERDERLSVKDIFCAQTHFITLKSVIRQIDSLITPQTYQAIGTQLYCGVPMRLTEQMVQFILQYSHEPSDCDPDPLRDVAELHFGYVKLGGDSRTAEIISFLHCLNLYTCPFFIHAENAERYNAAVKDLEQLLALFREEQARYLEETAQFVIDYDDIMED